MARELERWVEEKKKGKKMKERSNGWQKGGLEESMERGR